MIDPVNILRRFWKEGFTIALEDEDRLRVSPSSRLTDEQRSNLRRAKTELLPYLLSARKTAAALLAAASKVCDEYKDGTASRLEMRGDCLALPAHLHPELLEYFQSMRSDFTKGAA